MNAQSSVGSGWFWVRWASGDDRGRVQIDSRDKRKRAVVSGGDGDVRVTGRAKVNGHCTYEPPAWRRQTLAQRKRGTRKEQRDKRQHVFRAEAT